MTKLNDTIWRASVNCQFDIKSRRHGPAAEIGKMFGLAGKLRNVLYDDFELAVAPGEIAMIVGPSGSGKSVLLREFASHFDNVSYLREISSRAEKTPAEYLHGGPLKSRLAVLSSCGLAEATLLVTPAGRLSGGQKYRLALARAIHNALRVKRPALVIADEFCSQLDLITAAVLCRQIRKLAERFPVGFLLASPRVELLPILKPDLAIMKRIGCGGYKIDAEKIQSDWPDIASWPIRQGSIADYRELENFHYITGPPACHKRVYTIRPPQKWVDMGSPQVAAVAVVSPPVINSRGRNVATFKRYASKDKRKNIRLLNAEVETVSRVIVHPIFRGAGLAVRLVRYAIETAQTQHVEAMAAMGKINPFFEKAGMNHVGLFKGPNQYYHYYIAKREQSKS